MRSTFSNQSVKNSLAITTPKLYHTHSLSPVVNLEVQFISLPTAVSLKGTDRLSASIEMHTYPLRCVCCPPSANQLSLNLLDWKFYCLTFSFTCHCYTMYYFTTRRKQNTCCKSLRILFCFSCKTKPETPLASPAVSHI